jgi:predicted DNA-binding transcriptional regulator AlpA
MATIAAKSVVTLVPSSVERFLTPTEAAELLTIQPSTLAEYRSTGKGPRFVRLSKNLVRYKLSDVVKYIHSRQSQNPEEGSK